MGIRLHRLLWFILLRSLYEATAGDEAKGDKKEVLVKEVVLDSAVVDIVYLGKNHECLLLTTKSQRLYFSGDYGQSWNEITGKVDSTPSAQIHAERIIVNPADKTVAVLQTQRKLQDASAGAVDTSGASPLNWHPYIFITEDSGHTWRKAWGRHHGLHSWISHPTRRAWALVSWWNGGCNKEAKNKNVKDPDGEDEDDADKDKPCLHRLMLTTDLGKTFKQISPYVVQFSWGSDTLKQADRVYYTAYSSKTGDQGKLSLWTTEVDFKYVDVSDQGKPAAPVVSMKYGNKFMISNEFVLVAKVSSEEKQTVNLMVSSDGVKTWKAALLPSGLGELEEKWYTIIDTSEGAVLLHLNSEVEGVKDTGRIFVSDNEGYKYSQSLANNVRSSQGEVEIDKVVSLTGVYLANVVATPEGNTDGYEKAKQAASESNEQAASEGSEMDRKHGRGFNQKMSRSGKEERTIRTVISFDKGGSWSYLKPPKVNSLGQPYFCSGQPLESCALHLHGTSSWDLYAPFYSSESCVGIIMGTGNVGSFLRFEPEETSTFLSRDGGLTWVEAHKGAFIYEFGDHGGLIVMADDLKKTGEVIFTWNEGESWFDFKVSSTPFEVDNIITEPNLTATTFVMFGTREGGAGVLYYLKFDALQFPACKGSSAADSVSSDYETWTASDGKRPEGQEQCMLGQQVTYTRRKRTSQCWNGEAFERPTVKKSCLCTQADFACDVGFVRAVGSTECVFGGADMMPERFAPTVCQGTYGAPAYRKVPGNKCEGGWTPPTIEVPCPGGSLRSIAKWVLLLFFVGGASYIGYSRFCGAGVRPKARFGEVSAGSSLSLSGLGSQLLLSAAACCGFVGKLMSRSPGGYEKLKGDDFDMDGARESLNDFLDEADFDDQPPPHYSSADDKKSHMAMGDEESRVVTGAAARYAREQAVPRLSAPPVGGGPQTFDMTSTDEDLL
eukprot:gb/GFBE01045155.1/.p1 GENE.gb/GFBE01045155.1/~~gb/GFBE01045155.1/.p1  ORF type:complete len:949 (+),score=225.24 gb/GFBE01045155.1/:1-2847(+)